MMAPLKNYERVGIKCLKGSDNFLMLNVNFMLDTLIDILNLELCPCEKANSTSSAESLVSLPASILPTMETLVPISTHFFHNASLPESLVTLPTSIMPILEDLVPISSLIFDNAASPENLVTLP